MYNVIFCFCPSNYIFVCRSNIFTVRFFTKHFCIQKNLPIFSRPWAERFDKIDLSTLYVYPRHLSPSTALVKANVGVHVTPSSGPRRSVGKRGESPGVGRGVFVRSGERRLSGSSPPGTFVAGGRESRDETVRRGSGVAGPDVQSVTKRATVAIVFFFPFTFCFVCFVFSRALERAIFTDPMRPQRYRHRRDAPTASRV